MSSIFKAIGNLFGGNRPPSAPTPAIIPPAPVVPPPPVMPTPDDTAVQAARRKSIVAQMQRGGRASTILTDPATGTGATATSDKLGG